MQSVQLPHVVGYIGAVRDMFPNLPVNVSFEGDNLSLHLVTPRHVLGVKFTLDMYAWFHQIEMGPRGLDRLLSLAGEAESHYLLNEPLVALVFDDTDPDALRQQKILAALSLSDIFGHPASYLNRDAFPVLSLRELFARLVDPERGGDEQLFDSLVFDMPALSMVFNGTQYPLGNLCIQQIFMHQAISIAVQGKNKDIYVRIPIATVDMTVGPFM